MVLFYGSMFKSTKNWGKPKNYKMGEKSSSISGFYKLSPAERIDLVAKFADLTDEEKSTIANTGGLEQGLVDRLIENVVGVYEMPLGIAVNFKINDKDYLIPMAIEETSVVAAASHAAKIARAGGGFKTESTDPIMIEQIQLVDIEDAEAAKNIIIENKDRLIKLANEQDPILVKFGGGCKDVEVRTIETIEGPMVITHLLVDCRDAMGANACNTMAEAVAPVIEELTGGTTILKIISNLAKYRLARAEAVFPADKIGGERVVDRILKSYACAVADPYRCATHNKGIMNGVSAVVIATGNDFRAIEAGAHSYACINGEYKPLTQYEKNENGDLVGKIEIPVAVGLVGGCTSTHPTAKANVKILGVKTAKELGEVLASVGLAQNFAALRALSDEGIQKGHMGLHARNLAIMAGATGDLIDKIAEQMIKEGRPKMSRAKEILEEMGVSSDNS